MISPKPAAIRRARAEAGLTQTEAATLIWASLRGWQEWESGGRRMMPAVWFAFLTRAGLIDAAKALV